MYGNKEQTLKPILCRAEELAYSLKAHVPLEEDQLQLEEAQLQASTWQLTTSFTQRDQKLDRYPDKQTDREQDYDQVSQLGGYCYNETPQLKARKGLFGLFFSS